ncbi:sensor histidine kinase [Paenibacillus paeoniae]|uniref:histidine kinase n=1 Tax=Paenibacillus paeoniae TaxID=2292705 RepID=A0A371P6M9_9BACL|nr:HAMP domain-containing sensor histidine kinase [Paenibacillus paeoniae]REK71545.1 sensor histidine kinase [Paenibacillus paeoniae]
MNMKGRLMWRFTLQLSIAGVVALLIVAAGILWITHRYAEISITKDFASAGMERLVESSKLTPEGIRFDPKLLEQVKANNGWLQSLDETGGVEQSYNAPKDVPLKYAPGELVAYWLGKSPFPYHLYLWVQEKHGRVYTVVYGVKNEIGPILNMVASQGRLDSHDQLYLPDEMAKRLQMLGGFVQLINRDGVELGSYNKPHNVTKLYNIDELVLRSIYNVRYGYLMDSIYERDTGRTWIVAIPNPGERTQSEGSSFPPEAKVLLIAVVAMFLALVLVFFLLSLWNAHRFGSPMLHMLAWLDLLAKGEYKEPTDRKGIPRSRRSQGGTRSRYRVFSDFLHSIERLTTTLLRDRELRLQNKNLREEWISGITHDLKTPLSSIKGYAHMLSEERYEWSAEEVRSFSQTMLEKSAHMDRLINDLAITYRISAGVQPPEGEVIELNSWLRRSIEQAASHPSFDTHRVSFVPWGEDITIKLYGPWLDRVVMNLTANALLHNPPETQLTVSVMIDGQEDGIFILFTDNGQGMDEQTAGRLFERYYRGTDSMSMTEGTGLGMAIAKDLVEAMGGQITIDTMPDQGTTVRLSWPRG